jgi:hypothetical protein
MVTAVLKLGHSRKREAENPFFIGRGNFVHNQPVFLWKEWYLGSRVARFFMVQHTKTGENIPNNHKIYQMAIKYAKRP